MILNVYVDFNLNFDAKIGRLNKIDVDLKMCHVIYTHKSYGITRDTIVMERW